MKAALREVLALQIERIAKISVKNSIASSTNLLYTAFLMHQLARPESRSRLHVVFDEARKQGILFVQQAKGSADGFIRTAVEKVNTIWEDA